MDDWSFCKDGLLKLSRTFAVPIGMLEDDLERVVTCGYLLCRIADTVEDRGDLTLEERDILYNKFLAVVEQGVPAEIFESAYRAIAGEDDEEGTLACGLGRVLVVLGATSPVSQEVCKRWVAEMTRGMAIYSRRQAGDDGVIALNSVADLERYCYFVAGTVGQMLTELFLQHVEKISAEQALAMREHAEAFGAGLQLVNIIKDMSEDVERGWSFMPGILWNGQGMSPGEMIDPELRAEAHRAVAPVIDRAARYLDRALEYALAIPPGETAIRHFCLVPLWLAVATLREVRGNDDLFLPERKVKIGRDEVTRLVAECVELAADNQALRDAYKQLKAQCRAEKSRAAVA